MRFLQSSIPALLTVGFLLLFFEQLPNATRWPARILIVLGTIYGLWRFTLESRHYAQYLFSVAGRFHQTVVAGHDRFRKTIGILHALLAVLIVVASLPKLFEVSAGMLSSSLRTDEISSVERYSSHGPLHAASQYHRANNHPFFNLLNSVTPGTSSYVPWQTRLWAFVSVYGALLLILTWFTLRKAPLAGAVAFALIANSHQAMELTLEARGYGLLALLTVLLALSMHDYFASPSGSRQEKRAAILLALSTGLGIYTIPYYLIFVGPLLILTYLSRPSTILIRTLLVSGLLTILLYLPIIRQLWEVATAYEDDYGEEFGSLWAIKATFHFILPYSRPDLPALWTILLPLLLVVIAWLLTSGSKPQQSTRQCVALLCFAATFFLAACLFMETPPIRTTGFLNATVAVGLGFSTMLLVCNSNTRPYATLLSLVLAVLLVPGMWQSGHAHQFEGLERWREQAKAFDKLFPPPTKLWSNTDALQTAVHLSDQSRMLEQQPDNQSFQEGQVVLLDIDHNSRTRAVAMDEPPQPYSSLLFTNRPGKVIGIMHYPSAWEQPVQAVQEQARTIDGPAASKGFSVSASVEPLPLTIVPTPRAHALLIQAPYRFDRIPLDIQAKTIDQPKPKRWKDFLGQRDWLIISLPTGVKEITIRLPQEISTTANKTSNEETWQVVEFQRP